MAKQKSHTSDNNNAETNRKVQQIRLNKYISNSGICSRREADTLIADGFVKVNGNVITEMGYKVEPNDTVLVKGKKIFLNQNYIYILLNKPKDHLSTTKDTHERKTVMDLINDATGERVYPVGRLDRNTTGVLLLTNDGEITKALTHPSTQVEKIYAVTLDKNIDNKTMEKLVAGIELEDGKSAFDEIAYSSPSAKNEVGVKIHSGKNRIIRRMFEALGYHVDKLDRVVFASLTKLNLPRGKWRYLSEKEVRMLKMKTKLKT